MLAYYVSGLADSATTASSLLAEARQHISTARNWDTLCAAAIRELQAASYALGAAGAHLTSVPNYTDSWDYALWLDYQRILKLAWSGKNGVKYRCKLR